jgi:Zn-dependent M28 family amino/carboxypeptidase
MHTSPGFRRALAVAIVFAITVPFHSARAQAAGWLKHVSVLSNDSMRGRETGSREHHLAAAYIAKQFRLAGLRAAGDHGYFQTVRLLARAPIEEQSLVEIIRGGKVDTLQFGDDITLNLRATLAPVVSAPLVFDGYGLFVPEKGIDDLSGVDLAGKIVVVLSGGPASIAGPILSNAQSVRWRELRKRGAVGVITIADARGSDIPPDRARAARLLPQMSLADTALDETTGELFAASISAQTAERLFAATNHPLAELRRLAQEGKILPKFPIGANLRARVALRKWAVVSENVAGILPGSDRRLARAYVVLSAHLDHLGVGAPVNGDSIFNGALDNASGVAALIETAKAIAKGARPRRSIVFLAVTGEEKGLLGSRYFANHPTVPAASLVANVNTDMLTAFYPLHYVIVNGLEESDLAADVRRAAATHHLVAETDPEPERNSFIRSDQYSFIKRGIPAVSLKFGFVPGSAEHSMVKKFRAERYHAVGDDLTQQLDLQAVEDFERFYVDVVREIANRGTRPEWNRDSYFRVGH